MKEEMLLQDGVRNSGGSCSLLLDGVESTSDASLCERGDGVSRIKLPAKHLVQYTWETV
jgi:hypothetical protein